MDSSGSQTTNSGSRFGTDTEERSFKGRYDTYYNPLDLPVVNFRHCMVIAIFDGPGWNSAGHKVHSVFTRDGAVVIRYQAKSYQTMGPNGGGKQVTPYSFLVVPRHSKAIVLEKNVQRLIGEPPKWKEQQRFPTRS